MQGYEITIYHYTMEVVFTYFDIQLDAGWTLQFGLFRTTWCFATVHFETEELKIDENEIHVLRLFLQELLS